MRAFVKSVVTGFAFSMGAALFKKFAPKLGLDDKDKEKASGDAQKAAGNAASGNAGADDGAPVEDGGGDAAGTATSPIERGADAAVAWVERVGRAAARRMQRP